MLAQILDSVKYVGVGRDRFLCGHKRSVSRIDGPLPAGRQSPVNHLRQLRGRTQALAWLETGVSYRL